MDLDTRDRATSGLRPLLAGIAAFLLPGIFLAILMPALAPAEWNPGDLPSQGALYWMRMAGMASILGAVFGSPFIVGGLLIWKLLHKFLAVRPWSFALTGLAIGALVGWLFGGALRPFSWGYFVTFVVSGLLTGLAIWTIAYGQLGGHRKPHRIESASS